MSARDDVLAPFVEAASEIARDARLFVVGDDAASCLLLDLAQRLDAWRLRATDAPGADSLLA